MSTEIEDRLIKRIEAGTERLAEEQKQRTVAQDKMQAMLYGAVHNMSMLSVQLATDEKFNFPDCEYVVIDGKIPFPGTLPNGLLQMLETKLGDKMIVANFGNALPTAKQDSPLWKPQGR